MSGFLLDENLPAAWLRAIRQFQPQIPVWQVGIGDAPPKHTLDPAVLDWCETNDAILVTDNRRTLSRHLADHIAAGKHVPGIFIIAQAQDVKTVAYIFGASLANEYQDQFIYPPLITT